MILYGIKDDKAGNFFQPWLAINDHVAVRNVKTLCNDKSTELGKYPEDYSLYKLGDYDDRSGEIKPDLQFITNGAALVEVKNDI